MAIQIGNAQLFKNKSEKWETMKTKYYGLLIILVLLHGLVSLSFISKDEEIHLVFGK